MTSFRLGPLGDRLLDGGAVRRVLPLTCEGDNVQNHRTLARLYGNFARFSSVFKETIAGTSAN
jgi:hypothetical protein